MVKKHNGTSSQEADQLYLGLFKAYKVLVFLGGGRGSEGRSIQDGQLGV